MISREIIKYSLKNLWKNKTRSFLTIFSIFIGITTIFIFISFGLGLYNYVEGFTTGSSANKIMIQPKDANPMGGMGIGTFKFDKDDLDRVKNSKGIKDATGFSIKSVKINRRDESGFAYLTSYNPDKPLIMEVFDIEVEKGRGLQERDKSKAVLGHNYREDKKIFNRGLDINDRITINGEKIRVIGFMEKIGNPEDDSNIYITNDYFQEIFPETKDSYSWIIAEVENVNKMDRTIEDIEDNLRKKRGLKEGKEDFFVRSYQELLDSYTGALDIIVGFVILIALISILVSAVNTSNTMITSVLERVKEIGVIKSIGAKNSEIFNLFLFESSFLGFIGGILGVGLGFIISYSIDIIIKDVGIGFLNPSFPIILFIGCILFAIITGALSGILPAIRAAKQNPVDALRYE